MPILRRNRAAMAEVRLRRWIALLLLPALLACSAKVVRVDMDPARLAATLPVPLSCAHTLAEVVDARPAGSQAGGLSEHAFAFADVAQVVRQQLLAAGLQEAGKASPQVAVRVMQLYLAQNRGTKIPVAVYQVRVDGGAAFLLRSQPASLNWNGTQNEAYAAYARALAAVNQQLIQRLNAGCAKG